MELDPCGAGHAPTRTGKNIAALMILVACWVTLPAWARASAGDETTATAAAAAAAPASSPALEPGSTDDSEADRAPRASIDWRWDASMAARHPTTTFESPRGAPGAVAPVDYRLWLGSHRTEVGIGLGSASTVTLALRHRISDQSHLTLDAPLTRSGEPIAGRAGRRALDLGLESSLLQGLAKGNLLRAQLSAHSSLSLRLRGGRIGLYLGVRITGAE